MTRPEDDVPTQALPTRENACYYLSMVVVVLAVIEVIVGVVKGVGGLLYLLLVVILYSDAPVFGLVLVALILATPVVSYRAATQRCQFSRNIAVVMTVVLTLAAFLVAGVIAGIYVTMTGGIHF